MPRGAPLMRITMSIPVDEQMYSALKALSVRSSRTMAELVRRAVEVYLGADQEYWQAIEELKSQRASETETEGEPDA